MPQVVYSSSTAAAGLSRAAALGVRAGGDAWASNTHSSRGFASRGMTGDGLAPSDFVDAITELQHAAKLPSNVWPGGWGVHVQPSLSRAHIPMQAAGSVYVSPAPCCCLPGVAGTPDSPASKGERGCGWPLAAHGVRHIPGPPPTGRQASTHPHAPGFLQPVVRRRRRLRCCCQHTPWPVGRL